MSSAAGTAARTSRSLWSGVLVGLGVAGFVDETVFHQLLHWHHFYDRGTPDGLDRQRADGGRYVARMEIREATDDDWEQIWPFFQQIVLDGETYAYPEDLTSESARELWFEPGGHVVV